MTVSFDLFGTLVTVERPSDPATAVAAELETRGTAVPEGFEAAYRRPQINAPEGAETPLPAHVAAALRSCGADIPSGNVVRRAVTAAFDPTVETEPGAAAAVGATRGAEPVGVLSNCSVPELVSRTLRRSELSVETFDAVVTSVGCGWRKPDPRAFEAVASRLDTTVGGLVHVGNEPADGAVVDHGGRFVDVRHHDLTDLPGRLRSTCGC